MVSLLTIRGYTQYLPSGKYTNSSYLPKYAWKYDKPCIRSNWRRLHHVQHQSIRVHIWSVCAPIHVRIWLKIKSGQRWCGKGKGHLNSYVCFKLTPVIKYSNMILILPSMSQNVNSHEVYWKGILIYRMMHCLWDTIFLKPLWSLFYL